MTTETLATTGQIPTDSGTQQPTAANAAPTPAADASATAQPDSSKPAEATATATETTNTDPAKAEPAKADGEKPPVKAEPIVEYQDFTAPEDVKLDTELLDEFKGKAKEMGLSQDKAQQVVDLGVKLQQKWHSEQVKAIDTAKADWTAKSNADKEFGGEQFAENLGIAKKALDTFGTPELKQLLNESGLGNHPEIIRAFYRAGKAISEDRFVGGGNEPGSSVDPAKVLFPTMN